MDFIQAIKNAKNDGPFLLLTEGGVEGFTDLALCEERMAGLEGEPFALVRWLRSGGQSKNVQASPQPDRALTLNETSIRDSLEKIARHLKAGEMTEAKAALDALDFGRLFRTVQDPTKASRTDNAMPAF